MANPYHHAVSSARKHGGVPDDYIEIHHWFDESKAFLADFRHRALRHHAEGIFLCERIFGHTITLSTCAKCGELATEGDHPLALTSLENEFMEASDQRQVELAKACFALRGRIHTFVEKKIPVRWIGEQHVQEDLGFIPTASQWLECITYEPWMNKSRRLSLELASVTTEKGDAA